MQARPLKNAILATAVLAALSAGCEEGPKLRSYPVAVEATVDGQPLAGVRIKAEGSELGVTDDSGALDASLLGTEGQRMRLEVACPEGYKEPTELAPIVLRSMARLASEGEGPARAATRVSVECRPTQRRAVLVVRADGKPDLPILVQGERVARTSADGVGHALLELEPGAELLVALDTSSLPQLRPKNPARRFRIEDEDTILLFDQPFAEAPKPKVHRKRRPKPPPQHVPYRID